MSEAAEINFDTVPKPKHYDMQELSIRSRNLVKERLDALSPSGIPTAINDLRISGTQRIILGLQVANTATEEDALLDTVRAIAHAGKFRDLAKVGQFGDYYSVKDFTSDEIRRVQEKIKREPVIARPNTHLLGYVDATGYGGWKMGVIDTGKGLRYEYP